MFSLIKQVIKIFPDEGKPKFTKADVSGLLRSEFQWQVSMESFLKGKMPERGQKRSFSNRVKDSKFTLN